MTDDSISESDEESDKESNVSCPSQGHASVQISDDEESNSSEIDVHLGLPDNVAQMLSKEVTFVLPEHNSIIVDAILSGEVPFGGNPLISHQDLEELSGKGEKATDKWLTNFVINEYLKIISSLSSSKVKALPWEKFSRCSEVSVARELEEADCGIERLDLIIIPCNSLGSNHWFLLVAFPELKIVVALDSLSCNYVKPLVKDALAKFRHVLSKLQVHIEDWKYFCNGADDVLQQNNSYDCGVFVCTYARALALEDPLVMTNAILDFRLLMIAELHTQLLQEIPPCDLKPELYYAVDFVDKFYVGRLLSKETKRMLSFKFLHSSQHAGSTQFDWPRRDDIAEVGEICVFYGLIKLNGCGPFTVACLKEVESVFNFLKKRRKGGQKAKKKKL